MQEGGGEPIATLKQVIVMRRDLHMRRGKEIAQGAHASQAWLRRRVLAAAAGSSEATLTLGGSELAWLLGAATKITVYVRSDAELYELHDAARAAGVHSELVVDRGRTEFAGTPTLTALAIGPGSPERVDALTGRLPLY